MHFTHLPEIAELMRLEFQGLGEIYVRDGMVKAALTLPVVCLEDSVSVYFSEARSRGLRVEEPAIRLEATSYSWVLRVEALQANNDPQGPLVTTAMTDITEQVRFASFAFQEQPGESILSQARCFQGRAQALIGDLAAEFDMLTRRWEDVVRDAEKQAESLRQETTSRIYGT